MIVMCISNKIECLTKGKIYEVINENKEVSQPLSIHYDDYLVKVEDSSVGTNGYLVIPKDVFEFIFKEKGDHNEI